MTEFVTEKKDVKHKLSNNTVINDNKEERVHPLTSTDKSGSLSKFVKKELTYYIAEITFYINRK